MSKSPRQSQGAGARAIITAVGLPASLPRFSRSPGTNWWPQASLAALGKPGAIQAQVFPSRHSTGSGNVDSSISTGFGGRGHTLLPPCAGCTLSSGSCRGTCRMEAVRNVLVVNPCRSRMSAWKWKRCWGVRGGEGLCGEGHRALPVFLVLLLPTGSGELKGFLGPAGMLCPSSMAAPCHVCSRVCPCWHRGQEPRGGTRV